jgi:AraC family transcriptional regulator
MDPVVKAIWCVESRFASGISLDEIAEVSGVSRFHLCRAFGVATGQSVMRYVRGRRLTEAARTLAAGAPDILSVALDWGYGSHEAFTRAFREQFGLTPDALREKGDLDSIMLVEPIIMDKTPTIALEAPRLVEGKNLLIAGLGSHFTYENSSAGIPSLWQRFAPHIGHVPQQTGSTAYGVCVNPDDAGHFDYIAGVEVSSFDDLPEEFVRVRIPAQLYAVFSHRDHISTIKATFEAIFRDWLPKSGRALAETPGFERYDERFDPRTGNGVTEIWMPLKS